MNNRIHFELTGEKYLNKLLIKINKGSDINIQDEDGDTALILASSYGKMNICKLLLENGANINIQNNDGDTALIYGCRYQDNSDICKLLIENGADINIQNENGNTAVDIMKYNNIYKQVAPYKIIGLKYFQEVFKGHAEGYIDIFNTTLYSLELELEDIKANIDMFYTTIIAKMDNNAINESVEL